MTWKWVTIILAAAILAAGCSHHTTTNRHPANLRADHRPDSDRQSACFRRRGRIHSGAWQAYEPNRMVIHARHPEQAQQLDSAFKSASAELDLWHQYAALGQVGKLDATTFPAFRRSIITMLLEIEKGAQE
jgi:hypothetical protein